MLVSIKNQTTQIDIQRPDDRLPMFVEETFINEGEHQSDPNDKGNYYAGLLFGTIYGITARDHFEEYYNCYRLYSEGNKEKAIKYAKEFYRTSGYWNPLYNLIIDSSLAFKIWDTGVNAGVRRAVKILQKTATQNGVPLKVDGMFGRETLKAVNILSRPQQPHIETEFYYSYTNNLESFYRSLWNFFRFGKGWIKRVKGIYNKASNLPLK